MTREEILELDRRHLWHPYTPMRRWIEEARPLVVDRAEGARIWDVDGRSYLDANSSWWVATLGHRHPRLVAALRAQSERLCHVALAGITHEPASRLAAELVAVAPAGLARVFFSDDGSTAVELALKLCLAHAHHLGRPERRAFASLAGAFHGETLGVVGVSDVEPFQAPYRDLGIARVALPVPPERPGPELDRAIVAAGDVLAREEARLAGVVVEPVLQGASGMRVYAPGYLRALRVLCDRHELPLVADEVFTGYGRTGPMWACEHAGIAPDLLCTAKGFTGGVLPMAATLVSGRLFATFLEHDRAFWHGHSFCGNPLGAAVAREVLRVYRDEQVLERAVAKAARIRAAFEALASVPGVARTRSLGMMGALDLAGTPAYLGRAGWRVYDEALRRGVYLRPLGDVVYVAPPLTIGDAELDELLHVVGDSVRAAV
jgi:adenosylmethionine-8-amino-7-oxononanoate aminotransferase